MREKYQWDSEPRGFQMAGVQAQLEGVDMIIQAATGSGKTAIAAGPHLFSTSKGKITIMVSPLLALEEEMVHTFRDEFGLNAIAVHGRNGGVSPLVVKELLAGTYQVLLISPEMLQSRQFINRVLRNAKFASRILSVVVDEAHCAISALFLSRYTPFIALTATLTERVRRDLHVKLKFTKGSSRFVNVGNDRPNVSMVVRSFQHAQNSFADLDFVIPENVRNIEDIPKTMIYVDDIQEGADIIYYLRGLLRRRNPTLANTEGAHHMVRPYNAVMSTEYRREAMEALRGNTGKPLRIMVCTDAAGMASDPLLAAYIVSYMLNNQGCNIPDIDVVVQCKLTKTLSSWIQRAGRAARGKNRAGLAVIIVERTAFHPDRVQDPDKTSGSKGSSSRTRGTGGNSSGSQSKEVGKRNKEWAQAHGVLRVPSVPCCDICDPTLFDRTRPSPKTQKQEAAARTRSANEKLPVQGSPDCLAAAALTRWRRAVYKRDHEYAQYGSDAILPQDEIDTLTSYGPLTPVAISQLVASSWVFWEKHGDELVREIGKLTINYTPIEKPTSDTTPSKSQAADPPLPAPSTSTGATPTSATSVPVETTSTAAKRSRRADSSASSQMPNTTPAHAAPVAKRAPVGAPFSTQGVQQTPPVVYSHAYPTPLSTPQPRNAVSTLHSAPMTSQSGWLPGSSSGYHLAPPRPPPQQAPSEHPNYSHVMSSVHATHMHYRSPALTFQSPPQTVHPPTTTIFGTPTPSSRQMRGPPTQVYSSGLPTATSQPSPSFHVPLGPFDSTSLLQLPHGPTYGMPTLPGRPLLPPAGSSNYNNHFFQQQAYITPQQHPQNSGVPHATHSLRTSGEDSGLSGTTGQQLQHIQSASLYSVWPHFDPNMSIPRRD
ncbi:hypothetical protein EIP91_001979 [Steccherinum ochraceum]|uniref:DNA 3'-5' helicase n=1 Tax=Steccherinum ochraceum TaxID=92696 RepID=A0A4R0RLF5_9APHY|nr:hypothetical protein EIP91_001979 [Steccherinum ochraceum]